MYELNYSDRELYEQMVNRAFKRGSTHQFSNGKPEHAAYLIQQFFRHAQSTIRIFSGNLTINWNATPIFGANATTRAAIQFLRNPHTELRIVVDRGLDRSHLGTHPFIAALEDPDARLRGKFEVRQAQIPGQVPAHFLVMDHEGYRLETNPDDIGARACVNDEDGGIAHALVKIFDQRIWERATPIDHKAFREDAYAAVS